MGFNPRLSLIGKFEPPSLLLRLLAHRLYHQPRRSQILLYPVGYLPIVL